MVDSYYDLELVGHLDRSPLPGIDAVVEIARELKQLLFPGFHQRRTLREADAVDFATARLVSLHERLIELVASTLIYADEVRQSSASDESEVVGSSIVEG